MQWLIYEDNYHLVRKYISKVNLYKYNQCKLTIPNYSMLTKGTFREAYLEPYQTVITKFFC